MENTITVNQMKKIGDLYAQLGEDMPEITERFTKDLASLKITELETRIKKLSIFYCSREELTTLRNILNNTLMFVMFKAEVLEVTPEHLQEQLEKDSLLLDTVVELKEKGQQTLKYNNETVELLPIYTKVMNRVEKRKRIIAIHHELKDKVKEPSDILNVLVDRDSYRKFTSNHATEIKYWIEHKATVEQVKLIRQLTLQATGSRENLQYVYSLTKSQASKVIDRLTFERGLQFKGAENVVANLYRQFSKPNEEYYHGVMPDEETENWEKLIHSLSYHSGYTLECDLNDFAMLKEIVNVLVPQIGINKVSDIIQRFLTLDKVTLEHLGLKLTDYRLNLYIGEKAESIKALKNLINLDLFTKEEIFAELS